MRDKDKPTAWEIFTNFNKLNGGVQRIILDLIKWLIKQGGKKE